MKIFITTISICISLSFIAQQTTQFTQYVFNYFAFNPALAGSQECFNFKLGFRTQWVGFEGNPQTGFASFHTRLKFKKTRINRTHHGVGLYFENDALGYFGTTTLNLAYAYHFPVGRNVSASVGLFGGIQQFKVDAAQIIAVNYNDPAFSNGGGVIFAPYLTPGIFLNHDDWFAGLSVRQIFRNKWDRVIGVNARNRFHYALVGGKRFKLKKDINAVPSVMLKYVGFSALSIDANLNFEFNHILDLGISWRNQDAISIMGKLRFAKYFTVGYAFDFTTSRIRTASSNTHELIIGLSACSNNSKNTYICPVFD